MLYNQISTKLYQNIKSVFGGCNSGLQSADYPLMLSRKKETCVASLLLAIQPDNRFVPVALVLSWDIW